VEEADLGKSRKTGAHALAKMISTGVRSRPELEVRMGLGKASVSRIVDGWIRRGVVSEGEKLDAGTRGRKARALEVRPDAAYLLGTDLEGLAVRACVLDAQRRPVAQAKREIMRGWSVQHTMDVWCELLDEVIGEAEVPRERLVGVGVGLPGVVDADDARTHAYLPPGQWMDLDVRPALDRMGLHWTAANNTLAAGIYERRMGVGQGRESFLLVLARYGLGAAMFGNGRWLIGEGMFTCEFGHMRIGAKGGRCICGQRGCLDVAASGRTLPAPSRRRGVSWRESLEERIRALGTGIANLLKLFHTPLVILDGIYGEYADQVGPALEAALAAELAELGLSAPEVAFGAKVEFKASMGAALRAADAFLVDHLLSSRLMGGDGKAGKKRRSHGKG
jgi:predicted NBD/HSP70 family sugar kinase